jgi:hypothetical protein
MIKMMLTVPPQGLYRERWIAATDFPQGSKPPYQNAYPCQLPVLLVEDVISRGNDFCGIGADEENWSQCG